MDQAIILTGGLAKRLRPITTVTNKHLLPVYDRPLIYRGLELLKSVGIKNVTIVLGGNSVGDIVNLVQDGSEFDLHITYVYQREPKGISHAIALAEKTLKPGKFIVLLGDNVFLDHESIGEFIQAWDDSGEPAMVVLTEVDNPSSYGQPVFNYFKGDYAVGLDMEVIIDFIEKPSVPEHSFIVTGFYGLDTTAFNFIREQKESPNGELEIVDTLRMYLPDIAVNFYDGYWSDCGTPEGLADASEAFKNKGVTNVTSS